MIIFPLLLLALFSASTASAKLIFGPYLQSESPNTMLLCAWVESGDNVAFRIFPPEGKAIELKAGGSKPACAKANALAPEVEYRYELLINEKPVHLKENPTFLASSQVSQTFVIYGDTRSGDDSFDLAHRNVIDAIREVAIPDAVIHTGDFVETGKDFALWVNFFNLEQELLWNAPIYPSIGRSDQPPELMKEIFPLLKDQNWYSFDRADSHFVVLKLWQASSQPTGDISPDGEQAKWLQKDLADAKNQGQRYIYVVMHQPPMDSTGKLSRAASEVYMPLFENFDVTAVFSGAHFFSHFVRNGVHYFTNGGGGALLESLPPAEGVYRFYKSAHHFLILEIGRVGARIRAVNTQGEDFYVVSFDKGAKGAKEAKAPTYVESYFGGSQSVAMDVFFQYGCDQCKNLEEQLPDIAKSTGVTLVVTSRSLDDSENAAKLAALSDQAKSTPIVVVGDVLLEGMDQIDASLGETIVDHTQKRKQKSIGTEKLLLFIVIPITGILLIASFVYFRKKAKEAR